MSRQQLEIVAGAAPIPLNGNLLIIQNCEGNAGFFVLHDGAPHGERRRECATDFLVSDCGVIAMSWGLAPHELAEVDDDWRSSNSVAIGAFPTHGLVQVFSEFHDQPTARLRTHRVRP